MANRVNNMRRRMELLEEAGNQQSTKKSTMAIDKNAWFSGTEGENRPKVKTLRHFIEETASRQRAATEENRKKAEAAESQAKTQTFEEFLAGFTAKQRAAGDNLKNVTAPAEVPTPSGQQNTRRGPAPALPQKTMGADLIQSAANSSGYSFFNANKTPVKADQLPSFPFHDSPPFGASQSDQRSESAIPQAECEAEFNTQVGIDGQVRHHLTEFDDTLQQDSTFMWIPEEQSQKTIVDSKLGFAPQIYGFLISSDVHQYQLELQMWTTYVNPDPESFRGINPKGKSDLCHNCSEAGHAWNFCTQTCRWCHWCSDFH